MIQTHITILEPQIIFLRTRNFFYTYMYLIICIYFVTYKDHLYYTMLFTS